MTPKPTQFSTELAFDLLDQHREKYSAFNDDIQGTAAVSLAGFINAIDRSGTALKDQKIVFFGAGSAAVGIARLVSDRQYLEPCLHGLSAFSVGARSASTLSKRGSLKRRQRT